MIAGVVLLVGGVWWLLRPGYLNWALPNNERNAAGSLKSLVMAQVDFHQNDRDENGVNDFWRVDVRGLYALDPSGKSNPIKLIEQPIARADAMTATDA